MTPNPLRTGCALLSALLIAMPIAAQNTAPTSSSITHTQRVEQAQTLIEEIAAAYGGRDRVLALPTFSQSFSAQSPAVHQSPGTEPPWQINTASGESVIDVQSNQFVEREWDASEDYNYDFTQLVSTNGSYQVDYRGGTASVAPRLNFDDTTPPYQRVTPVLLVRQLIQNAHRSFYMGTSTLDGQPHHAISLVMDSGPVLSLFFDLETHLLEGSERVLPGAGLVEYRFLDYKTVDGIPFNQKFQLIVSGDLASERTIANTSFLSSTQSDNAFALSKDVRVLPAPTEAETSESTGPTVTELAEGVRLIGENGTYAMFVEMEDHVVAVGGTAGIAERMGVQRKTQPTKPIRYGVMTHHHSDHVLGAGDYAAEGITVLAATAHETIVRNAFGDAKTTFEGIDDTRDLSDNARALQIIDIGPTVHAEHLLVAWLPKERILFQADHFGVRPDGSVGPANANTRSFAQALKRHRLAPKLIVSAHDETPATAKQFKKSLKLKPRARPAQASR